MTSPGSFVTPLSCRPPTAGRPRDLEDAAGVERRKGRELDWAYIRGWATEFTSVPGREHVLQQAADLERRQ